MTRILSLIVAIAFALALAAPGFAREKDAGTVFRGLDMNNNGSLSLQEYLSSAKDRDQAAKRFNDIDTNHDGSINLDEWTTYISKHPHTTVDPADM